MTRAAPPRTVLLALAALAGTLALLTQRGVARHQQPGSGAGAPQKPVALPITVPRSTPAPSVPKPTITVSPPTVTTTHTALVDACERAIWKEVPIRRVESPLATRTLAVNLVSVCHALNYPLDLALGHAFVESSLQLRARNSNSGAVGPIQVTPISAAEVGVTWPIESPVTQLEVGIKYMQHLRRTYPDCASSVRETLRMFGMGPGNYRKYRDGQLTCSTPVSVARAELGCAGNRPYSATAIAIAQRHPELHTVPWWGTL